MAGIYLCIRWSALHSHSQKHDREVNGNQFDAVYYNPKCNCLTSLSPQFDTYRVNRLPWNTAHCTLFSSAGNKRKKKAQLQRNRGGSSAFCCIIIHSVNSQNLNAAHSFLLFILSGKGQKNMALHSISWRKIASFS